MIPVKIETRLWPWNPFGKLCNCMIYFHHVHEAMWSSQTFYPNPFFYAQTLCSEILELLLRLVSNSLPVFCLREMHLRVSSTNAYSRFSVIPLIPILKLSGTFETHRNSLFSSPTDASTKNVFLISDDQDLSVANTI